MATKVIHVGTGFTGKSSLKAVLNDPALELVGWWVHSPDKVGVDAGTFCGMDAIGVKGTTDIAALMALKPDALNYAANTIYREMDAAREIASFLEAGINVVTFALVSMIYPPAGPPKILKLFQDACQKGGSSFLPTGSEPGILSMTIPGALLSGAGAVTSYREQQFVLDMLEVYAVEEVLRESMGFGKPSGTIANRFKDGTTMKWWKPNIYCIANMLGVEIEDFNFELETCDLAAPLVSQIGRFEAGTIGGYYWQLQGLIGGVPAISVEYIAYLHPSVPQPAHWPKCAPGSTGSAIVYQIEGEPSFKNQIYLASPEPGGINASIPMTALHAINAIPVVVAAAPGVYSSQDLPRYYARDVRFGSAGR